MQEEEKGQAAEGGVRAERAGEGRGQEGGEGGGDYQRRGRPPSPLHRHPGGQTGGDGQRGADQPDGELVHVRLPHRLLLLTGKWELILSENQSKVSI